GRGLCLSARVDVPARPRQAAAARGLQPASVLGEPSLFQAPGSRTMTIDFEKSGGLVPAVAQDDDTGEVLMLAWMNRDAYEETLRTGRACYFSRTRATLWRE